MSRLQSLKDLINQRLTAAVEEIFGHFERIIAEYEEEMDRRHRTLFDVVLKPQVKLRTEADIQQLLVVKEFPPEMQEWSSSLDQEDPEPPHIKEEQEELWTSQEGEQLQGLEEADITKFPFAPVSEDDEEERHSSQLRQRQTEQMETEAEVEDCGGPELARNSDPDTHLKPDTNDKTGDSPEPETDDKTEDTSEPESDDSDDGWKETRVNQSVINSMKNDGGPVSNDRCNTDKNLSICSECGKRFGNKTNLKVHMIIHTREKPFSCTACGKRFSQKPKLIHHMKRHTRRERFSCSVCKKRYRYRHGLCRHMKTHTGGKLSTSCVVDTNLAQ